MQPNSGQDRDQDQPGPSRVDYACPGTIMQEVHTDGAWMTDLDLIFYAYQIATGMDYLSSHGVSTRPLWQNYPPPKILLI